LLSVPSPPPLAPQIPHRRAPFPTLPSRCGKWGSTPQIVKGPPRPAVGGSVDLGRACSPFV
jgi:hypothetical protein